MLIYENDFRPSERMLKSSKKKRLGRTRILEFFFYDQKAYCWRKFSFDIFFGNSCL